jgi:hypothetical protein
MDIFYPYVSGWAGGFDLSDSFRIPRPCAYSSYNMTSVEYYRGQKAMTYDISVDWMSENARIQY